MQFRSEAQKAASRNNGAKSNGPRSAEARQKSSLNSLKHGFASKKVLLPGDDPEEFFAHRKAFLQRFQPADASELLLVEDLTAADWRIRRILDGQTAMIELSMRRTANEHPEHEWDTPLHIGSALLEVARRLNNPLLVSTRYLGSLRQHYTRKLKELETFQAQRRAAAEACPTQDSELPDEPENSHQPIPDQQVTSNETRPQDTPSQPREAQLPDEPENRHNPHLNQQVTNPETRENSIDVSLPPPDIH